MSALPKAVRDQIRVANEIAEQIKAAQEPPELDAEGQPVVPPAEIPAEPVVEPVAAVPEPAAPAPAPPQTDTEKADHRFKVLQGKYNAEVPRLQTELKTSNALVSELRQRVNNTESLLAAMNTTAAAPTPAPAPAATAPPGITDEERAQFGPDLIDVIERVAAHKLMPEVDARVAPLQTSVDNATQSASQAQHSMAISERDKTIEALSAAVPNWEQQNEDDGFLSWLNENDVYAGVPRGRLLTDAFRANDSARVIAFFKGFQTENAIVTPSDPTPLPVEPQVKLDDLTAPGTPKPGTTSAPNESGKRVWTRNDISAFYAKKNEYVKKGNPIPDEYMRLERDLIAAQHEGRIR